MSKINKGQDFISMDTVMDMVNKVKRRTDSETDYIVSTVHMNLIKGFAVEIKVATEDVYKKTSGFKQNE